MSDATLLWGVLFGAIGMGFFAYGRRQSAVVPFIAGLGLMVFPYFVSSTLMTVLTGALLIAAGVLVRF
ncbi:MAG: hypothetical protein R3E86_18700 [Pseudomonadales bacterium]